ncbi:hypothetical protein HYALB_00008880 [Hymenoscyphus albidus]|uniref:Uncharacterized protein n=1 Tax=Hymenoscyphus albidus TaxID=595503 RepID=A0A9N9LPL6_9HELO|nr:hypothetical protein HYALB_00008880 [Hymenoscyphus albidus]
MRLAVIQVSLAALALFSAAEAQNKTGCTQDSDCSCSGGLVPTCIGSSPSITWERLAGLGSGLEAEQQGWGFGRSAADLGG